MLSRIARFKGPFLPLVAGLVAHGLSVLGQFSADDFSSVLQHPVVNGQAPLWDLLSYNHQGASLETGQNLLRPLSTLLFAFEYRLMGADPLPFHIVSLLSYLVLVWVAYLCLADLVSKSYATVGASLFAALAIHAEAVAAVAFRSEVLSLLFALVCFRLAIKQRVLGSVLAFAAAVLSKESAVFIPFVIVWYWFVTEGARIMAQRIKIPLLLIVMMGLYIGYRATIGPFTADITAPDNVLMGAGLAARLWTPLELLGMYLCKTVVPVDLAFDYTYSAIHPEAVGTGIHGWVGLATALGLAAVCIAAIRDRGGAARRSESTRLLLIGGGAFALSYALFSNSVFLITIIFAERFFLGPSFWAVLIGISGFMAIEQRWPGPGRALAVAIPVVVLAIQIPLAIHRVSEWRSPQALHGSQVLTQPLSVKGQLYYARLLARTGQMDEAVWRLALVVNGKSSFPGPWKPRDNGTSARSIEERLLDLPALLGPSAPGKSLAEILGWFRVVASEQLGPESGAAIDRVAVRLGMKAR